MRGLASRQPRAVYKYWVPCRACLSLRPLVPDSHLFAVLFGSTVDIIRQSTSASVGTETDTHSATVLVSGDSTVAVPGQGVLALRCATTGASPFLVLLHRFHRCAWQFQSGLSFLGCVHRYTARGSPAIRVAGTPGACSQVFCHPIRCIVRTRQDRLAVSLIIRTHTHTHTTPHHTHHTTHTHTTPHATHTPPHNTQNTQHTTHNTHQTTQHTHAHSHTRTRAHITPHTHHTTHHNTPQHTTTHNHTTNTKQRNKHRTPHKTQNTTQNTKHKTQNTTPNKITT